MTAKLRRGLNRFRVGVVVEKIEIGVRGPLAHCVCERVIVCPGEVCYLNSGWVGLGACTHGQEQFDIIPHAVLKQLHLRANIVDCIFANWSAVILTKRPGTV